MADTISEILVRMKADVSNFLAAMGLTSKVTKKTEEEVKKSFSGMQGSFKSFAGAVAGFTTIQGAVAQLGSALLAFASNVIKGASQLNDMSDALGVSTEAMQKLGGLFKMSGATMEDAAAAMNKLQVAAANAAEDIGGKAAEAIHKLGLSIEDFKALTPDKKMEEFAIALAKIKNPSERAAVAQELLGKSARKVMAALAAMAEAGGLDAATKDIIVNTKAQIDAIDKADDEFRMFFDNIATGFRSAVGELIIFSKESAKLQNKFKGPLNIPTTQAVGVGMMGGIGYNAAAAAIRNAPATAKEPVLTGDAFWAARKKESEAIAAADAKAKKVADELAEALRKKSNAYLASITVEKGSRMALTIETAKYQTEIAKATDEAKKEKIGVEELQLKLEALRLQYIKNTTEIEALQKKEQTRTSTLLNQSNIINDSIQYQREYGKAVNDFTSVIDKLDLSLGGAVQTLDQYNTSGETTLKFVKNFAMNNANFTNRTAVTFTTDPAQLAKEIADERERKNNEERLKRIVNVGKSVIESSKTEKEAANERVKDIQLAIAEYTRLGKTVEVNILQTRGLKVAMEEAFVANNEYFATAVNYASQFAENLATAVAQGKNFGESLRNVFGSILQQIQVLIIKTLILQAIMAAIGLIPGVGPTAASAFGKMTGIVPRASGGPVMGGSAYHVGEFGPETFIPATAGVIVPANMSKGSGGTVIQNIYVQTGVAQTVRAEMMQMLPAFRAQAVAAVLDTKSRGGTYARNLAAA